MCDICGGKYKTKELLAHHKKDIHVEKTFACPGHCDMKFKHKKALNLHVENYKYNKILASFNKRLKSQPFACVFCELYFNSDHERRVHADFVHAKEFPFACGECPLRFKKDTMTHLGLKQHFKKHSTKVFAIPPSEVERFKCLHCKNDYSLLRSLLKHMSKKHKNKIITKSSGFKIIKYVVNEKGKQLKRFVNIHDNLMLKNEFVDNNINLTLKNEFVDYSSLAGR